MKTITYLFLALFVLSCGTKKNSENGEVKTNKNETTPITMDIVKVWAKTGEITKENGDPIQIDTVEIRGNIMYIDVTYSGGCEEHSFEVIGSNAIAKSMPPIRAVQLIHNANGDTCRELKKVKLEVYIDELAERKEVGREIYLTIDGWKDRIYYKYVHSN